MIKKRIQKLVDPSFFGPIAHRGLHDEKRTENGLEAFRAAIEAGLPFELDIHLTKDGNLLVCHDSDLIRTTGRSGIIEELSDKEIEEGYHLLDGERVPRFQEVLDLNEERSLIVVELKVYNRNYKALAKAANQILKQVKNPRKIVLISFDPRALARMDKRRYLRSLLIAEERIDVMPFRFLFDSLDVEKTLLDDKRVVRFRRKGHPINVWTIDSKDDFPLLEGKADAITFQSLEPKMLKPLLLEDSKIEK